MAVPTPPKPEYFNYPKAAEAAGFSADQLAAVIRMFEAEYPDDLMLRELHILRACEGIAEGMVTFSELMDDAGGLAV